MYGISSLEERLEVYLNLEQLVYPFKILSHCLIPYQINLKVKCKVRVLKTLEETMGQYLHIVHMIKAILVMMPEPERRGRSI